MCAYAASEAAAAASASKASRGWGSEESPAANLPEPNLVVMRLDVMKRVLLEAAVLGCMLFEAEEAAEAGGGMLSSRSCV